MTTLETRERRYGFAFQLICMLILLAAQFLNREIQLQHGLGWDGVIYARMARQFRDIFFGPPFLEGHLLQRAVPSWLVGFLLHVFGLSPTPGNLVLGFRVLNSASALAAWGFFRGITRQMQLRPRAEAIAFSTCFLTYYFLADYPYHPLTIDCAAFALGLASFYFYLRSNLVGLLISTLVCGFTWRGGYLTGLLLLAFPRGTQVRLSPSHSLLIERILLLVTVILFGLFYRQWMLIERADAHGATKVDRNLLPLSALVGLGFALFVLRLAARSFHASSQKAGFSGLTMTGVASALGVYLLHAWIAAERSLNVGKTGWSYLREFFVNGLVVPGQFLASAFIFFGPIVVWTLVSTRSLFESARSVGLGLHLALCGTLLFRFPRRICG
jgi:hypothetical protein